MWTAIGLGVVLTLDLGLAIFLWRISLQQPEAMKAQRGHLELQARELRADVERGEKIYASLPQAGKDADAFYQQSFMDAGTGYSRIEGDLADIARKSGVRISGVEFKQKELKDRGVIQIDINTALEADYPAVVQFINGLERSKNFYLLDSLRLTAATTGGIRLDLELHTYFRT